MKSHNDPMDAVFRALAEPVRRDILDALRVSDGLTVSELEAALGVTRFVVMKHVKVLEEASLVTSRKAGRFRHVHLNAAPIQALADRWIAPIVRPYAKRLANLKWRLETEGHPMGAQDFRLITYIRTTQERLWRALTDPDDTVHFEFNARVESDWAEDSPYQYIAPDGSVMLEGVVVESDPPRKLVTTFVPRWGATPGPRTMVTYLIEPMGGVCKLTLIHEGLSEGDGEIREGWAITMNGLKTWLETGEPLNIPLPTAEEADG